MSLVQIAAAVRSRHVSAVELVERVRQRVNEAASLNSVVVLDLDRARADAATLDLAVVRGQYPGPLGGVPFLVKDVESLKGAPTSHGSALFRSAHPAAKDGVATSALRRAGAIPVGKTNTPEFATEGFTDNLVFGPTLNPWAPDLSPGGSSGGSSAAIAAGIAPIATATDTGGSIRVPAAFCGLVGLKPTNNLLLRDACLPWPRLTTSGPLGATTADVRTLLDALRGNRQWAGLNGQVAERPLRRVVCTYRLTSAGDVPSEIEKAFARAVTIFESDLGLPVEWIHERERMPGAEAGRDWFRIAGPELVRWIGRERAVTHLEAFHPATRAMIDSGLGLADDEYKAARRRCGRYRAELDAILGEDTVIACPTVVSEGWLPSGPRPGVDEMAPGADVYNTLIQNMTGHPAVSLPAGLTGNGLPFGIQLTGPRLADLLLLDLADRWETVSPPPITAPGYERFW